MELKNCCFCVNLRSGSLIIGYIHLWFGFCMFFTFTIFFATSISQLSALPSPEWFDIMTVCMVGFHVLLTIISIGITIYLIYGIHKNISRHIQSYLIYNTIFLIYHLVDFIFNIVFKPTANELITDVINIAVAVYFLLVIKSYWLQLRTQEISLKAQIPAYSSPSVPVVYSETMEKAPSY